MKMCKCGSFAINDDPDGVLCDKCLLRAEISRLKGELEEASAKIASMADDKLAIKRDYETDVKALKFGLNQGRG